MNQEVFLAMPVFLISAFAVLIVVLDAVSGKNKTINFAFGIFSLLATAGAAIYTLTLQVPKLVNPADYHDIFTITKNTMVFSSYSAYFDILFSLAGILTMLASRSFISKGYHEYKEYYSIIILAVAGMVYISHANNLLMLFIGIELMSIMFYILSGYFRQRIESVESALKYFLLGSFASGFLLYGMALVYGATSSLELNVIAQFIAKNNFNATYLTFGIALLLIGLSFKIAAFPFHQWAPDVYQGAPTTVTAFMSTAGKAAAIFSFIIIAKALMPSFTTNAMRLVSTETMQMILAVLSAATMLIGNITAISQKNIKRMLAYSSVAHAGYMLMGVVANNQLGYDGIIFYATSYLFMQIGAFIVLSVLENNDSSNINLDNFTGLRKSNPYLAALMAIFMFSLAGLPPFAGFFGKYYLFLAAIQSGYTWLTIVAVISSVISVYFYIGLIVYMFFKDSDNPIAKAELKLSSVSLFVCLIGVLLFGFFPSLLMNLYAIIK